MVTQVNTSHGSPNDGADPTPRMAMLSAQVVVERLRELQQQIPDIAPLTKEERKAMRKLADTSAPVVQASIMIIGASDVVEQGVGQPADDVRQLVGTASDWRVVERELKAMWRGVFDANLVRRQRIGLAVARAYLIGQQLARDPKHAELRPYLEEVKRLRALARRKKKGAPVTEPEPEPPAPEE
jgi:hypothetical protein